MSIKIRDIVPPIFYGKSSDSVSKSDVITETSLKIGGSFSPELLRLYKSASWVSVNNLYAIYMNNPILNAALSINAKYLSSVDVRVRNIKTGEIYSKQTDMKTAPKYNDVKNTPEYKAEMQSVHDKIAEEKAGSQIALAKMLGQFDSSIRQVKAGKKGLPDAICIELADFLKIDRLAVIAASNLVTEKNEKRREIFEKCIKGLNRATAAGLIIR